MQRGEVRLMDEPNSPTLPTIRKGPSQPDPVFGKMARLAPLPDLSEDFIAFHTKNLQRMSSDIRDAMINQNLDDVLLRSAILLHGEVLDALEDVHPSVMRNGQGVS